MRIKLAIATGVAAVVLGSGTAAYAVVAQGWMNPTSTGNVLPIDDNHSPVSPVSPAATTSTTSPAVATDDHGREPEPGDDRGGAAATSGRVATSTDDRGREAEPGDDRGGNSAAPTSRTTTPAGTATNDTATTGDDRGRGRGGDDGAGHS